MDGWKRTTLWRKFGTGFCVEVSHHTVDYTEIDRGCNRWCVYAYIYQSHPLFASFKSSSFWQDAALSLPLHGGPTFFLWHHDNEGKKTSIQVGADYDHRHDSHYTHLCDKDDACTVFNDAEELVHYIVKGNYANEN